MTKHTDMGVFKVSNKKDQVEGVNKLAGVYISQQDFDYLILYTLNIGITKSSLLRKLIENWVRLQLRQDSEESLIKLIVDKIRMQWMIDLSLHSELTLEEYKLKIGKELRAKGINPRHIELILKKITDGKN